MILKAYLHRNAVCEAEEPKYSAVFDPSCADGAKILRFTRKDSGGHADIPLGVIIGNIIPYDAPY